ncbi:hypothetical protein EIP91_012147 [Steccherinum ochraceum]|uniref:Glucose-methanol-choline oxidoreductase N-terminal domain-containing protein n=1 Tax=Steccherinum ochraceum TaxID=92696 RepID=A0A4V2MXR8_9APHY|nr:hypothetical protein EIP91_012147 [Steccherinum ochraceum]
MTAKIESVANKPFDYVIAGGGTAGLTLAVKLSEDPHTSVLVLEAGGENIDDPIIMRPGYYGVHFGQDLYAWPHKTIPQKYADGLEMAWARGKGLGGSSSINFFNYDKPPAEDVNDFERLGNPGWNWEHFNSALRSFEGFVRPSNEMLESTQIRPGLWQLGTDGPVKTAFPPVINVIEGIIHETMFNLGIPAAPNPLGGDCKGFYLAPLTHDARTCTRSYATTAFYLPNKHRSNLHVLTFAHVVRVITEPTASGDLIATGVEFLYNGQPYVANANKEVIVSAGTLKSPQILELSGIGDPQVLNKISVPVKVALPGVGANVQDHLLISMGFELKDNPALETFDMLSDPAVAEEHLKLHKSLRGLHTQGVIGYAFCSLEMITDKAEEMYQEARRKIMKKLPSCSPGLQDQYKLELDRLRHGRPGIELLTFTGNISRPNPPTPGKKHISLHAGNYHCISRGTIHCTTADPLQDPEFDPHYFEEDVDLQILIEGAHYVRKVAATSPLKDIIARELNPGPSVELHNNEQMRSWIKKYCYSPWHTSSSCSMLPREKNGVVDSNLKVYGTTNVRVVDLSIIPVHVSAHTQSVVYGIAARAAEIITGVE